MKVLELKTKEELNKLYNQSALTVIGLEVNNDMFNQFTNWLIEKNALLSNKELIFYVIKGQTMNKIYKLTGDNAYPNDLNIVSVDSDSINTFKLILNRFEIGAKWFDDVVDNNALRERKQKSNTGRNK